MHGRRGLEPILAATGQKARHALDTGHKTFREVTHIDKHQNTLFSFLIMALHEGNCCRHKNPVTEWHLPVDGFGLYFHYNLIVHEYIRAFFKLQML